MNSKEFLIEKLELFLKKYNNISIRYKHNSRFSEHLIEILPKEIMDEVDFLEERTVLYLNFIEKFPSESLVFFSDGDFVMIDKPDYENQGCNYCIHDWLMVVFSKTNYKFDFNHQYETKNTPKNIQIAA